MATIKRKCWLTFEGGTQQQPRLWQMSQRFPEVLFDIRQASVNADIGIMAVLFEGEEEDIQAALDHLIANGVKVDPVEGGSLLAG